MNKAAITSPKAMSKDQVKEDISMTPVQRLELAFHISDFAIAFQHNRETSKDESTSIQWIELQKISTPR